MAFRPELRPLNTGVAARDDAGLGCAPIGNLFSPVTDDDAVATVHAALAREVRFFDTAPLYGSGESERKLGIALQGVPRDDYVLATKVGRILVDAEGMPVRGGGRGHDSVADLSRDGVLRSLEGSLSRLGVDRVDVLHLHDPLDVAGAFSGALPALVELRAQGVVRAISVGLGRLDPLERYAAEAPLDVVMEAGRLTLLDRSASDRLIPIAAARGIGVLAAAVFNSGILVDPIGSPFFEYKPAPDELRERALRLQAACGAHGVRLADAAVQFPLRQGADAVVVGARTPAEVDAFVDGLDAALPEALWATLDAQAD
ncbi:aldo/keto reductase [Microbacterium sp. MYb66]|jgi:D-threo-aldose 1-dehydrogenase|uniref:aldo/keto reductase n=1 Tax=Microbacterium sp. MYb66 TaxID=1848692 RepID=UPI000CFFF54D|nr:aldo/keto reductase [Microbacterium sp. MYb66]PRA78989.1 aldo/keto reductase [Microbacterium sp. MYb66]